MEISSKRLILAFSLIFILGIMFSIVNGFYVEESSSQLPLITYAIAFFSLIIGGFIALLFQWKINKIQLERVLKILPEEERKILRLLLQNNNSLEQNKLVALTSINKVKMSRLIKELEMRGVVRKTDLGNTNLVVLNI